MKPLFYFKNKKKIEPVLDENLNQLAKLKLDQLLQISKNKIPVEYLRRWEDVALYHPTGDIDKANAIIIDPEDGAYDLANQLNDLTGKQWVKFTCSWFVFNALQKDLREEREVSENARDHPATFSPTMIEQFIEFFTKRGENVLDPFCGIGSTLVACRRTGRIGYGIELNTKYCDLSLKRVPEFKNNVFNVNAESISRLDLPEMAFSISSPPYWDVLNRSTRDFATKRKSRNLDVKYSGDADDLGNISNYEEFVERVSQIYFKVFKLLKNGGFLVVIVKNVKKDGRLYPLAWDLARKLSEQYQLKDEKIWIQDKIALAPYGYPSSWASNILHHYCLVFQKK